MECFRVFHSVTIEGSRNSTIYMLSITPFSERRDLFFHERLCIKSKFHQFVVSEEHRDLLRFLWWLDGDPSKEVVLYEKYCMKAHLFGVSSSPGCAHFGLRWAADDREDEFSADAATFTHTRVSTLMMFLKLYIWLKLLKASVTKPVSDCTRSNKKEVLEAIPAEDHAKRIKELNLAIDSLLSERALGVMWCA